MSASTYSWNISRHVSRSDLEDGERECDERVMLAASSEKAEYGRKDEEDEEGREAEEMAWESARREASKSALFAAK